MMTTETLDRSIAAFREAFGPAHRFAALTSIRSDVDLFVHTAALRNLNGCVTRFVRDGRDVEPPAVFTDTLRRGERGELTTDELRMLDEIQSDDYRVTNEPARRGSGADDAVG